MKKNKPAIKAVIFDMGGVILRTESLKSRTKLAKKFGLVRKELEAVVFDSVDSKRAELGEFTETEHWNNIARALNFPPDDLMEFRREFWDGDQEDIALVEYIRGLREKYKTGLLSNAWHGVREMAAQKYHFLTVFDAVVYSADVHLRKPDPRVFRLLLGRLGVSASEAVFVDDFVENVEGAQAVGMEGVLFKGTEDVIERLKKLGVWGKKG